MPSTALVAERARFYGREEARHLGLLVDTFIGQKIVCTKMTRNRLVMMVEDAVLEGDEQLTCQAKWAGSLLVYFTEITAEGAVTTDPSISEEQRQLDALALAKEQNDVAPSPSASSVAGEDAAAEREGSSVEPPASAPGAIGAGEDAGFGSETYESASEDAVRDVALLREKEAASERVIAELRKKLEAADQLAGDRARAEYLAGLEAATAEVSQDRLVMREELRREQEQQMAEQRAAMEEQFRLREMEMREENERQRRALGRSQETMMQMSAKAARLVRQREGWEQRLSNHAWQGMSNGLRMRTLRVRAAAELRALAAPRPEPPVALRRSALGSTGASSSTGRVSFERQLAAAAVDLDYDSDEDGAAMQPAGVSAPTAQPKGSSFMSELMGAAEAPSVLETSEGGPDMVLGLFTCPTPGLAEQAQMLSYLIKALSEVMVACGAAGSMRVQARAFVAYEVEATESSVNMAKAILVSLLYSAMDYLSYKPEDMVGLVAKATGLPAGAQMRLPKHVGLAMKALVAALRTPAEKPKEETLPLVRDPSRSSFTAIEESLGLTGGLSSSSYGAKDMMALYGVRESAQSRAEEASSLGQGLFETGLRALCESEARRRELADVVELLQRGLSVVDVDEDDGALSDGAPGVMFLRRVAELVGRAHTHDDASWAKVLVSEQSAAPSAQMRDAMHKDKGARYLNAVYQSVGRIRAGVQAALEHCWRVMMRRDNIDAKALASTVWYGRWRSLDLKKVMMVQQSSNWVTVTTGAAASGEKMLNGMWAMFTAFWTALTHILTQLSHRWDLSLAGCLQAINSEAVQALASGMSAATVVDKLPGAVFARFDDMHQDFRTMGRALPRLQFAWSRFKQASQYRDWQTELATINARDNDMLKKQEELKSELVKMKAEMEKQLAAVRAHKGGGSSAAGGASEFGSEDAPGRYVTTEQVKEFNAKHQGKCWRYHLKGFCAKGKECSFAHGTPVQL